MRLRTKPVTAWNADGSPCDFGDPEYGDGEEFDTYECIECLREDPKHCTFDNPARLPIEDPDAVD